jgi:hypothetical protein
MHLNTNLILKKHLHRLIFNVTLWLAIDKQYLKKNVYISYMYLYHTTDSKESLFFSCFSVKSGKSERIHLKCMNKFCFSI